MSSSLSCSVLIFSLCLSWTSASGEGPTFDEKLISSGTFVPSTGYVVSTDDGVVRTASIDMSLLGLGVESFVHTNLGLWDQVNGVRFAQGDFAYSVDADVSPVRLRVLGYQVNGLFQPAYDQELASVALPDVDLVRSTADGRPIMAPSGPP